MSTGATVARATAPMNWIEELLDRLGNEPCCGYYENGAVSTEPTALAALALAAHDRRQPALAAADWLAARQVPAGSLGVREDQQTPRWPTSLAVLAWLTLDAGSQPRRYGSPVRRALAWLLSLQGEVFEEIEFLGHDTTLAGWPWVAGTHSWVEPTCLSVLALKAAELGQHARTREAVRLLLDRQLPHGGCNCGNTIFLGQELRPHVQPSGMSLLALAGERDDAGRIATSLGYLRRALAAETTSASLAWAVQGLAAHEPLPAAVSDWLGRAYQHRKKRGWAPYQMALLALAARGVDSPLVKLPQKEPAA